MAKITNDLTVKELKQIAEDKGITYNKNATATQMQELLWDIEISEKPNESINEQLLKRINDLEKLVRDTGDTNKIKDFDRNSETRNKFAYSVKLFPTRDYMCPVIKWETISNFVDLSWEKIKAEQIIEITYLNKDWTEEKKSIDLLQFVTFLKKSDKVVARKIKNLDGTDVYISKQINPETKLEYYTMHPTEQTYNVTLEINWQEITILSTYLNA